MVKLCELNVINIDAIEKFTAEFLPQIEFEPARKWFQKSVRNLLINDEKFNTRIAQVSPTAPEWMKQRYKENVPLYRFQPSGDLTNKLSHIVDWLNSVHQVSQEKVDPATPKAAARQQLVTYASKLLNSLNSIDMKTLLAPKSENVKHHVDDWFEALNKFVKVTGDKDQEVPGEDMHHVIDYDNGAWVELKSAKSLDIEGKLMGHCVGGYHGRVAGGATKIYSLRDNDNEPHVTIEITDNKIVQVKGKGNKPPVSKYVPYVKDFLNKMKVPPTGGTSRYSSGAQDIKQIGLYYNAETQMYGSIKEVAKLIYTTPDGYEILSVGAEEGDKPDYAIWKSDKLYGYIRQSYGNEWEIALNEDRETYYTEENKKIFSEGLDFLNSAFKDFTVRHTEAFGFFRISKEDPKYYDIDSIPDYNSNVKFSGGIQVKQVYNEGSEKKLYIFTLPGLKLADTHKFFFPLMEIYQDGRVKENNYKEAEANIPDRADFEVQFANFLNKNIDFGRENDWGRMGSEERKKSLLDSMNIIYVGNADGGYKTYLSAATLMKDFGSSKIFNASGIYRFYSGNDVLAEWEQNGASIKTFKIEDQKLRKYSKQLVDFFNENSITPGQYHDKGKYSDSTKIKNTMKEIGIVMRGEKWSTGKTSGSEGWAIEKVGPKQANIVSPEGIKIATLKFENATTVEQIEGDRETRSDKELMKSMLGFLAGYNKQNPKLTFNSDALKSAGTQYGYMIHNNKLVAINEIFPSEDILTVDNMTWKKKAVILKSDKPDEGYKYGLYDAENKLCVVLKPNIGNPKEIEQIIIGNTEFDSKRSEEDYDYRRENKFTKDFVKSNVAPYMTAISEIFSKEGFTAKGVYLSKAGIQIKNGKLQIIEQNPKLEGFIDGVIQYEDGFSWRRDSYNKNEWYLYDGGEDEDRHAGKILSCIVSDDGISQVSVKSAAAKKKPSIYRSYLNDLLDVVEEMNAEG